MSELGEIIGFLNPLTHLQEPQLQLVAQLSYGGGIKASFFYLMLFYGILLHFALDFHWLCSEFLILYY